MAFPKIYDSGHVALLSILESRIDLDADMVELVSKEINQYNRKVSLGEDISEEFLIDINQLQDNTMLMPPTLIASFFGMNVQFGWFIGHSYWTWIIILVLMVVSI